MTESTPLGRALLLVDVQPTFCEGGELPVAGGNRVAREAAGFLRRAATTYDLVVTTQDFHIDPGPHFSDTPDFVDTWPPHGVAGTPNAELHPELVAAIAELGLRPVTILKGQYAAAYSGFDGTDDHGRPLAELLREAQITTVDVSGLAESHCVRATALDAVQAGLQVRYLRDLSAPVSEELGRLAREEMRAAGVSTINSTTVPAAKGSELTLGPS